MVIIYMHFLFARAFWTCLRLIITVSEQVAANMNDEIGKNACLFHAMCTF